MIKMISQAHTVSSFPIDPKKSFENHWSDTKCNIPSRYYKFNKIK